MRNPITKEQLEALPPTTRVDLIDVRTEQEYEKQHIPEAINIPPDGLSTVSDKLSKTDVLICICNHGGNRSRLRQNIYITTDLKMHFILKEEPPVGSMSKVKPIIPQGSWLMAFYYLGS